MLFYLQVFTHSVSTWNTLFLFFAFQTHLAPLLHVTGARSSPFPKRPLFSSPAGRTSSHAKLLGPSCLVHDWTKSITSTFPPTYMHSYISQGPCW